MKTSFLFLLYLYIITLWFKEIFFVCRKFSYLGSVSTRLAVRSQDFSCLYGFQLGWPQTGLAARLCILGGRYTRIAFFRLIERKYLKGKSVPATKRFSARGLKIRIEVGRRPIYRRVITLRFKENFSFAEKFSYLSSVSTRREICSPRFLSINRKKISERQIGTRHQAFFCPRAENTYRGGAEAHLSPSYKL